VTSQTNEPDEHVGYLTGGYALDALDDVERARVERHLATCDECAAEVTSFSETAAVLAAGTTTAPPPGMRDRVLAEASRTRQLPPRVPVPVRRARANRWLAVAAVTALLLAGGLGGLAYREATDAAEMRAVASAMSDVMADPGRQLVDTEFAGGHGTVVVSGDRVVVMGDGVPDPAHGHGYQLWLIGADGPRPAGMMTEAGDRWWVDASGFHDGDVVGVTVEPAGGSEQPTTEPVLVADVAQG